MGCHTWCYTHLKTEAERWNQELIDLLRKEANSVTLYRMDRLTREQRKKWLDDSKRVLEILKDVKPEEIPELALKNEELFSEFDYDYGQYLIHDGKIYRETSLCNAKTADGQMCFPQGFHDMFRIYDYAVDPCYSLKDCLDLCDEYHVDWNATEPSGWLINNRSYLELFWALYPDSVVVFG